MNKCRTQYLKHLYIQWQNTEPFNENKFNIFLYHLLSAIYLLY